MDYWLEHINKEDAKRLWGYLFTNEIRTILVVKVEDNR